MIIIRIKQLITICLDGMAFILIVVFFCNAKIIANTSSKTYSSVIDIEKRTVGLVLGTSPTLTRGYPNLYFTTRVKACIELYKANKIEYVLVSGDNSRSSYDEPTAFKDALTEGGIPASKIFLDYAGFRTLDSVVRAKEVFGQTKFTVISQDFHNQRAIYLAQAYGMDVIGYNADNVKAYYGFKTRMREYLAKTKAIFDLSFNVEPKYLGPKVYIK